MEDIIFDLVEAFAVLGNESGAIDAVLRHCPECVERHIDKNNNLILTISPGNHKKHIMLDAHLDQVGLIVTNVWQDGFLQVAPCGGVDARVLPGSLVRIYSEDNKTFDGIVTSIPPHLSKEKGDEEFPKISELFVDTGLRAEELNLIKPGDFVGFTAKPLKLLNKNVAAPGLDNRAGVAAVICCLKILAENIAKLKCKVSCLFSTGEEVTAVGAKTAAFSISPDIAISVDTSFADQKNVPPNKCGKLSLGPMVGISPILSKEIASELIRIAKLNKIPYQNEIMPGKTGTNADVISLSKCGIPTALLSIPLRYMHTPVEIINMEDVKNTARLLACYILEGGASND